MHIKFPKIQGFHNVRKSVSGHVDEVNYRGKVKLHGTNAGVQIKNKEIFAQSRERTITPGDDNMGFARWVFENEEYFKQIKVFHTRVKQADYPVTVFGEWCGQGIMSGTGISDIGKKIFAVFAIQVGYTSEDHNDKSYMIVEPEEIRKILPEHDDVFVLPWLTNEFEVNFVDTDHLECTASLLNGIIEGVEQEDPWVKETFGISGIGEGVVFVPIEKDLNHYRYSKLAFKAKGEKHKVNKQKKSVQIDPEVAASIDDFVANALTEARLEQGAREASRGELSFDKKKIGPFLKWITQDVKVEMNDELEASELNWKLVQKAISNRARMWYINKSEEI